MSLKCLAAQSIRKYNLDYQGQVMIIIIIIMVLIYVIRPSYNWTPKFHDDFLLGSQVPREFHPHPRALRSLISFLFGLLSPQEIKTEGSLTSKHLQIFFVCHSAYHLNSPINLHSCLHKIYILIYWIGGIVTVFIKDTTRVMIRKPKHWQRNKWALCIHPITCRDSPKANYVLEHFDNKLRFWKVGWVGWDKILIFFLKS